MASNEGDNAGLLSAMPFFQEKSAFDQCLPNMTMQQRLLGFLGCVGFGTILSFMGTMSLLGGPSSKNIRAFVTLYVLGNIIALCATGFLLGPKSQCKQMWHPTRRFTTGFYLFMLILVFAVAITKQHIALIIFLLLIEVLAGIWYTASYIPYARKMILGILRSSICKPCFEAYDQMKGNSSSGGGGGGSASTGNNHGFTVLATNV